MKIKFRSFVCILLIAVVFFSSTSFAGVSADARDIRYNSEYIYEVLSNNTITIHCYIGNQIETTVPSVIDALPVVSVERLAFYGTKVKVVTIGEGITTLKDEAFFYSIGLESVTLPSTLSNVGQGVFRDCLNLKSVVFSGENSIVGEFMFYGCSSLENLNLSDSLGEIPVGAFSYCMSLTQISLPEGLDTIREYGFFASGLESVTLPLGLKYINSKAFAESKSLTEIISLSTCYSYVAPDAFQNCGSDFPYYNTQPSTTDPTETEEVTLSTDPTESATAAVPNVPTETAYIPNTPKPPIDEPNVMSSGGSLGIDEVTVPGYSKTDPTEEATTLPNNTKNTDASDSLGTEQTTEYIQAGDFYIGSSQGFLMYENSRINEANTQANSNRTELLALAWNVRTMGDSNNDGKVNIKDATQIQRYVASFIDDSSPNFNYKNSDTDADGKITIKDATVIQKYVAGIKSSLD